MGRPINPRKIGDPAKPGLQVTSTVLVDVGEGVEGGVILRQRSNNRYLVEGVDSSTKLVCKLVNGVPAAVGEMSVAVFNSLVAPIAGQDETDYDGAGDNGTFSGGAGYAATDTITLTGGTVVTVDSISADLELIAAQDQANFDGTGDNGTFAAGSGYSANDVITLNNNSTVTVNTVDTGGEVLTFTVTTVAGVAVSGVALTQSSVDPAGGTGFTLTPDDDNLSEVGDVDEFTVTTVGSGVASGSTLVQTATSGSGTGFELELGDDNEQPGAIDYARNINNRTVKTFGGVVYAWPKNVNSVSRVTADIQSS